MTHLDAIAARLRRLPWLADMYTRPRDTTPAARRSTPPGPRLPMGVGEILDELAAGREQGDQLARLGGCVRVVVEEVTGYDCPDLAVEGRQTWRTEVDWLLATMDRWQADAWCVEWIDTETTDIERTLALRGGASDEAGLGIPVCSVCGGPTVAHMTETLKVVTCEPCDRVLGMRTVAAPAELERARRERVIDGARRMLGLA